LPFCIVYLWYGAYIQVQVQVQVEAAPGPESLDGCLKAVSWSSKFEFGLWSAAERAPTHLLGAAVNTTVQLVLAGWLTRACTQRQAAHGRGTAARDPTGH
jgi:hypothetical protein